MATPPTANFRVSQVTTAAPNSTTFVDYLQLAVAGGEKTFDFFSGDMGALQQIAKATSKGGEAAWTHVDDPSSLGFSFLDPKVAAAYIQVPSGTMVMQLHTSAEVFGQETTDYKEAGIATTHLVTDAGTVDVIVSYVEKLGPAIAGVALGPAISVVFKAVVKFVRQFISKAFEAAEEGGVEAGEMAGEAAEEAASEAAVEGEVIADELAISMSFGPLAIVGLAIAAVMIVISAILFFLSKTMTCFVRVYNFTDQSFTLTLPKSYDLETKQEPKTGLMPPVGVPPAPPGVKALDEVIYRADYVFVNQDQLKGEGVVIQAGGTPDTAGAFPGLTLMFDVPSVGANSMYLSLDGTLDAEKVWDNLAGRYKELHLSTCAGEYRAYMATNQLQHESKSPVTGETGYFYEYLIVIEKQGMFFKTKS